MKAIIDIQTLYLKISSVRKTMEEVKALGQDFPAVARNSERILASLKMLDINLCDLLDLGILPVKGP
jgi:hypothetical protein